MYNIQNIKLLYTSLAEKFSPKACQKCPPPTPLSPSLPGMFKTAQFFSWKIYFSLE